MTPRSARARAAPAAPEAALAERGHDRRKGPRGRKSSPLLFSSAAYLGRTAVLVSMAHYGSSGEARHIQLVQDTAKGILECLQSSSSKTSLLRSLAEQRPWHELLHHFGELSRLLKGRQGTAQHEDSETSLWTQSLLDQFVLEPREVREPYCRSRRVLTCGLTGCDAGATERPSGPSEPLHARNTSWCAAVLHCVVFGRPDVYTVCVCTGAQCLTCF